MHVRTVFGLYLRIWADLIVTYDVKPKDACVQYHNTIRVVVGGGEAASDAAARDSRVQGAAKWVEKWIF